MRKVLLITLLLLSQAVWSGEHKERVDKFDGKVTKWFGSSSEEYAANNENSIAIRDYDPIKNTVTVFAITKQANECRKYSKFELKSADGTIHKVDIVAQSRTGCSTIVSADLIKEKFAVRVPIFNASSAVIEIDTSNLDLGKIAK
jgi:hypothetical protein